MTSKSLYRLINLAILTNSAAALMWIFLYNEFAISLIFIGIVLMLIGWKMWLKCADIEDIVSVFD